MVVVEGLTLFEKLPLPVPVTVPPPLLRVSVHAPDAVTVPVIFVLPPSHIAMPGLVIFAVGRVLIVNAADVEVTEVQLPTETTTL